MRMGVFRKTAIRLLVILLLALLNPSALASQGLDRTFLIPRTGELNVPLPAAEKASLARHLESSFDYSTGRATINVPLLSLSGEGVSFSVSMSYQTGGLKVEEEPGPLGAGWTLNTSGFIARTVIGRPDEDAIADNKAFRGRTTQTSSDSLYLHGLAKGEEDRGLDRYSYQAGTHRGQFVIDFASTLENCQIKEIPTSGATIRRCGSGFAITIPDGTRYRYEPDETTSYRFNEGYISGLVRHTDYGPTVTRWRLAAIANPQRTDSIVFEYENAPTREEERQRNLLSVSCTKKTYTGGSLSHSQPGLPPSYGHYTHAGRHRVKTVTARTGCISFSYGSSGACSTITLKDPSGTTVRTVSFSYVSGGVSIGGHRRALLQAYSISSPGATSRLLDGAQFSYTEQGTPMSGMDFFGYCNGRDPQYDGVLDFPSEGNGSPLKINPGRKPNPACAGLNSLCRIESASGGVTAIEYEPSVVPNGWKTANDSTDLTIGLRIRRETVSDPGTGLTRVRELEYFDPLSSIDMRAVPLGAFVSVGGHRSNAGIFEDMTTGATLLAQSRLPGARPESAAIYYGRVREKVSGTGMARPAISEYEFDTDAARSCFTSYDPYIPSAGAEGRRFAGRHAGYADNDPRNLMEVLKPMPAGGYFVETAGEKVPMTKRTEYRISQQGDTIPIRVSENWYGYERASQSVEYYCEPLVRSSANNTATIDDFRGVGDFDHFPVIVSMRRAFLEKTVTTEYADDGSSRRIATKNWYTNHSYPDTLLLPEHEVQLRLSPTSWDYRWAECGKVQRTQASCAGDTATVTFDYSCSSMDAFYLDALQEGWTAMPLGRTIKHGSDSMRVELGYQRVQDIGYRLSSEELLTTEGGSAWRADILGWTPKGNPSSGNVNGGVPSTYSWDAAGVSMTSSTVGGKLSTHYTHIPLVGLTSLARPSGMSWSYEYENGRLARERVNGQLTRSYGYSLWGDDMSEYSANVVSTTTHGGSSPDTRELERFNALGHKVCEAKSDADGQSCVMSLALYDALGRKARGYVPTVGEIDAALSFPDDGDPQPAHSRFVYPWGADMRPRSATIPGAQYELHPAVTAYAFNQAPSSSSDKRLECRRYKPTINGCLKLDGYFPTGALEVEDQTDGDGVKVLTFTDWRGRTVLSRQVVPYQQVVPHGDADAIIPSRRPEYYQDTYYVYDDADKLVFVLPPLASSQLSTSGATWSPGSCEALDELSYIYEYDASWRMSSIKAPGTGRVDYVYDATGELMLTQDAEQRERGRCWFSIPDSCSRVAVEGECGFSSALAQSVKSSVVRASFSLSGPQALGGWSVPVQLPSPELHAASYYDDYSFKSLPGFSSLGLPAHPRRDGLRTGRLLRVYGSASDPEFVREGTIYDDRERPVQTYRSCLDGGVSITAWTYDNADRVKRESCTRMAAGVPPVTLATSMTYDGYGRLSSSASALTPGGAQSSTSLSYGPTGLLDEEDVCSGALVLSYSYAERGALESVEKDGGEFLQIDYSGRYGGGISGIAWTGDDGVGRGYAYSYDGAGRLLEAQYSENGRENQGQYGCLYTYDRGGRLTRIRRSGLSNVAGQGTSATLEFGSVDDLSLSYEGALLTRADDSAPETSYGGASDFHDGASQDGEIAYDACGRMVRDLNQGIDSISYNRLGLPQRICMDSGCGVENVYSADGMLLRRRIRTPQTSVVFPGLLNVTDPGSPGEFEIPVDVETIDYVGPLHFQNGALERAVTREGYIRGDTAYCFVRDHQGSIRQVVNAATGRVVQESHYYPYGGLFGECTAEALSSINGEGENQIRHVGKELLRALSLVAYDYSARYYNPLLGSFWTPDGHRESYMSLHSYSFCGLDPVNLIDPTGLDLVLNGENNSSLIFTTDLIDLEIDVSCLGIDWGGSIELEGNEVLSAALDIAGIVDPTGVADGVNAVLQASNGQWGGALISAAGTLPYFGDVLKAGKIAKDIKIIKSAITTVKDVNKLNSLRRAAVRKAWKEERELVRKTGEGTRKWSPAESAELLKTGKVKGYEGHHINNVNKHPDQAGDPNNIAFLNKEEHLKAHGGNFRNETTGSLIDRKALMERFLGN